MDNKIKIVLTDINEDARLMLQSVLERSGRFIVTGSTGDGNQALQLVRETKPDLLLLDLLLPGLDGLSVLRRLEGEDKPQVLAVSHFVSQDMVAEAGSLGAAMFVSKPYNETAIMENLIQLAEIFGVSLDEVAGRKTSA